MIMRCFDAAKFITLVSLSLLISCKVSNPNVGLKISSLPTFALKCPCDALGIYRIHAAVTGKNQRLYRHF
jgi:hypothetical protein